MGPLKGPLPLTQGPWIEPFFFKSHQMTHHWKQHWNTNRMVRGSDVFEQNPRKKMGVILSIFKTKHAFISAFGLQTAGWRYGRSWGYVCSGCWSRLHKLNCGFYLDRLNAIWHLIDLKFSSMIWGEWRRFPTEIDSLKQWSRRTYENWIFIKYFFFLLIAAGLVAWHILYFSLLSYFCEVNGLAIHIFLFSLLFFPFYFFPFSLFFSFFLFLFLSFFLPLSLPRTHARTATHTATRTGIKLQRHWTIWTRSWRNCRRSVTRHTTFTAFHRILKSSTSYQGTDPLRPPLLRVYSTVLVSTTRWD